MLKVIGIVRETVVTGPHVSDGELVVTKEIEDSNLRHDGAKEIGTLVHASGGEKASV